VDEGVEEGVPPESPAESAAKLITAKSNAGFEEGESARAQLQSELTTLENAVDSTTAEANKALESLAAAKVAAEAAEVEAKAAGTPEEVLTATAAGVAAASEKATAASTTALETAEEVKTKLRALDRKSVV
jgi:hypothetical protein